MSLFWSSFPFQLPKSFSRDCTKPDPLASDHILDLANPAASGTLDSSVLYTMPRTAMIETPGERSPRVEVMKWLFPLSAARLSNKLQL